jgi:hypothetical protein
MGTPQRRLRKFEKELIHGSCQKVAYRLDVQAQTI